MKWWSEYSLKKHLLLSFKDSIVYDVGSEITPAFINRGLNLAQNREMIY